MASFWSTAHDESRFRAERVDNSCMQIGELSERTGVPARMLRYYEEQHLLTPVRAENGYRHYPESTVNRVNEIRDLIESGLPTRIVRQLLPCRSGLPAGTPLPADAATIAQLTAHLDIMDRKIDSLVRNRDSVKDFIARSASPTIGQRNDAPTQQ
jgi:DNA-binding transcriptional MerR regulator